MFPCWRTRVFVRDEIKNPLEIRSKRKQKVPPRISIIPQRRPWFEWTPYQRRWDSVNLISFMSHVIRLFVTLAQPVGFKNVIIRPGVVLESFFFDFNYERLFTRYSTRHDERDRSHVDQRRFVPLVRSRVTAMFNFVPINQTSSPQHNLASFVDSSGRRVNSINNFKWQHTCQTEITTNVVCETLWITISNEICLELLRD